MTNTSAHRSTGSRWGLMRCSDSCYRRPSGRATRGSWSTSGWSTGGAWYVQLVQPLQLVLLLLRLLQWIALLHRLGGVFRCPLQLAHSLHSDSSRLLRGKFVLLLLLLS